MTQLQLVESETTQSVITPRPELHSADLEGFALKLDKASPLELLSWAANQYGKRLTFATGFGPEGCVMIDLIGRHNLPIDIFTLDTGLLFPETRDLWKQLEDRYRLTIRSVKPIHTVDQQAEANGENLWEREPDHCCQLRKVRPLKTELSQFDAWITAIRREQSPERANAKVVEWDQKFNIAKVNPLVQWAKRDVWSHLETHDVPYNPLHDKGYPSIGCQPCTTSVKYGEDERSGRWRGFVKSECGLHGPSVTSVQRPLDRT